jgi:hypothetical protein
MSSNQLAAWRLSLRMKMQVNQKLYRRTDSEIGIFCTRPFLLTLPMIHPSRQLAAFALASHGDSEDGHAGAV